MKTEYMGFTRTEVPGRKTPIVTVSSLSSGATLGEIKWYGPWRQYCFYPSPTTIFNTGCMSDIQEQIKSLMDERNHA